MNRVDEALAARQDFPILFVDDEKDILTAVKEYLTLQHYNVTAVDSGLKALELVQAQDFEVVFTDLKMPEFTGLDLLAAIKKHRPEIEVVIVTGYGTIETAIEALRLGSYDYLQKPIKLDRLKVLVDRIIEKKHLERENLLLSKALKERYKYGAMVGVSPRMQELYEVIDKISQNDATVFIQGESGTGKELVAKIIHQNSPRNGKPFVPVNCGAIAEGLLESELFGHVKGAFSGAIRDTIGLFKAAEGGTIFLDEVAEISPALQVKLLRVLQEKRLRPVGETVEVDMDVRVIAAMNRDPDEAIQSGVLRKDLFYRLNVVPLRLPPLRERREDIPLLVNHFIHTFSLRGTKKVPAVSPEAMEVLITYDWPGNVRQLENAIERAFALEIGEAITLNDLPADIRNMEAVSPRAKAHYSLRENEVRLIREALGKTAGNKFKAAKLLGINVTTLYRKLKSYEIADAKRK
jgi:DNA-binding NtrC family response regulator